MWHLDKYHQSDKIHNKFNLKGQYTAYCSLPTCPAITTYVFNYSDLLLQDFCNSSLSKTDFKNEHILLYA